MDLRYNRYVFGVHQAYIIGCEVGVWGILVNVSLGM